MVIMLSQGVRDLYTSSLVLARCIRVKTGEEGDLALVIEIVQAERGVRVLSSQRDVLVRLRDRLDTSDI